MTEPGARATSVRRTVTVATALIASQAVLCAVIGWVTFGGKEPAIPQTRAAEPLLGPPIVVPPAGVAPIATPPKRSPAKPEKAASSQPKRSPAPIHSNAPAARRTAGAIVTAPSGVVRSGSALFPRVTPSASAAQSDVVVGAKCDAEKADGVTTDGKAVRCVLDKDGNLVWQII